jgi:hypothetical protein
MRNLFFFLIFSLVFFRLDAEKCDKNILIILVDARELSSETPLRLWESLTSPRTIEDKGLGIVGHAWVYLHAKLDGEEWTIEGGHSGDIGKLYPCYFDAVERLSTWGNLNATPPMRPWKPDRNPVRVFWEDKWDGFFQEGSGGHRPTYSVYLELNEEQVRSMRSLLSGRDYLFERYNLMNHQCCSFIQEIALRLDLEVSSQILFPIPKYIQAGPNCIQLWSQDRYSTLPILTPGLLQEDMKKWVAGGKAKPGYMYYKQLKKERRSLNPLLHLFQKRKTMLLGIYSLPKEIKRWWWMRVKTLK